MSEVGDPLTGQYLLDHGFALAGSSYSTTGWAIQQAIPDQIATRSYLNASAAMLDPTLNTAPPAFIPYEPTPFLRPFDLGRHQPHAAGEGSRSRPLAEGPRSPRLPACDRTG